jgi:DNA-binding IclR family transcriptional regulator
MGKALSLLGYVAAGTDRLADLADVAGLPKSTTYRLLNVLVDHGFLRLEERRYRLGYRLMELGEIAKGQVQLSAIARPHMQALAAATSDTVHLGELVGTSVVYLEKVEGARGLQMRSRVGLGSPACTTAMGKVMVAARPESEWRSFFSPPEQRTPNTIVDFDAFVTELRDVRARGRAFDREENELGICCVAAPVVAADGEVRAAVSLTGAVVYLPPGRLDDLVGAVEACAAAISRELGGRRTAS